MFSYVANPYEIVFDGALVFAQDSVSYSAVDAVPALVVPQRVNLLGYLTNASPIANYGTGASTGQSLSFWNCPSFRGCLWEQERSAGKGKGLVLVVGEYRWAGRQIRCSHRTQPLGWTTGKHCWRERDRGGEEARGSSFETENFWYR